MDRLWLDVGQIDSRTGRHTASATFRITDRFRAAADIDQEGEVRGLLKFLVRFK
ncbi:MAG: hypothetical protein R3F11_04855 [Verrucomicrobiales bacterium]